MPPYILPHRVHKGDTFVLQDRANVATGIIGLVRILYDDGSDDILEASLTTLATFAQEFTVFQKKAINDGYIVDASIGSTTSTTTAPVIPKGQVWARLYQQRASSAFVLCEGWISTGDRQDVALGQFEGIGSLPWALADVDATWTQANAAGGAVKVDITPGTVDSAFYVNSVTVTNSGTNGIFIFHYFDTSVGEMARLAAVGSGVTTQARVPNIGTNATATNNLIESGSYQPIVAGDQMMSFEQSVAGALNDTFRVTISIAFKGALPTFATGRSTNPGNVSVTAGSITWTIEG